MTTKKQTKPKSWAYTDRTQGKIISVNPPVYANGKVARRSKTHTGGLLGGVGFGGVIGSNTFVMSAAAEVEMEEYLKGAEYYAATGERI